MLRIGTVEGPLYIYIYVPTSCSEGIPKSRLGIGVGSPLLFIGPGAISRDAYERVQVFLEFDVVEEADGLRTRLDNHSGPVPIRRSERLIIRPMVWWEYRRRADAASAE